MKYLVGIGIAAFVGLIVFWASIRTVDQGERCVVTEWGRAVRVIEPGLNLVTPFISSKHCYNIREVVYETSDQPDQSKADYRDFSVAGQTSDGQQISVKYSVRFSADPNAIMQIYSSIAENMDRVNERVIKFCTRSEARLEMQKYEAKALYSGNLDSVQEVLKQQATDCAAQNHVLVSDFVLRKIDFDPDYIASVEKKQIAFEGIQTASYEAKQAEQNAIAAVNTAQGAAKIKVIDAQAQADAVVIAAKAQAEANDLITKSLSPELLQYQYITKLSPTVQTIYVPVGQQFILPMVNTPQ